MLSQAVVGTLGSKLIKHSTLKCRQKMKWPLELQLKYKAKRKLEKGTAFRMGILQAFRWLVQAAVWSNALDK